MNNKYLTQEKITKHIDDFLKSIVNSQEDRIILVWEAEEILNLIQKQQAEKEQLKAELEKKDKIIDEMAKTINQTYFDEGNFWEWFEEMLEVQETEDTSYVVEKLKNILKRK